MKTSLRYAGVFLICGLVLPTIVRADVGSLTFNDFESGTQDWEQNNFVINTSTPGPNGSGDNFLLLDRNQGASRIGAFNQGMDWTGNFSAAGVVGVSVDLKNLGDTELNIRFSVSEFGPGSPIGAYTEDVFLPIGQDWTNYTFSLLPGDLLLDGVSDASQQLENAVLFRIYDNALDQYTGGFRLGTPALGVDNIRAIVPEPSTLTMLALGGGLVAVRRRRRT